MCKGPIIPVSFEISEAENHQAPHSLKKIRNTKQPVPPPPINFKTLRRTYLWFNG